MSKVHNFSAGPCILPRQVFEKSAESILDFKESGLSIIEISHRSKDFVEVMDKARSLVKEILKGRSAIVTGSSQGLGYSIAEEFRSANNKNVLIGYDTRQSCKEIVNILSEGLYSNGFKIFSLGIAPTPAVSKLTRDKDFSIGIMISASHNPYHDNGLKIFDENGIKLSSNVEASIEKKIKLYSQQEIFQAESKIENSSNLLDEYKKNCIHY